MTSKEKIGSIGILETWRDALINNYHKNNHEKINEDFEIIKKDLLKIEYLEIIIYKWIDYRIVNFEDILSVNKSYYIDGALQMLKELKMILDINLKSVK